MSQLTKITECGLLKLLISKKKIILICLLFLALIFALGENSWAKQAPSASINPTPTATSPTPTATEKDKDERYLITKETAPPKIFQSDVQTKKELSPTQVLLNLLYMFLVLVIVCILAVFSLQVILKGGFAKTSYSVNLVKVIERVPLSTQKSLYLVQVADRLVLLGISENNINYLTEIDKNAPEVIEKIEQEKKAAEAPVKGFSFNDQIARLLKIKK